MEIERLKVSHVKRNIIIAVIVVLIISAIILNFTSAKYRTSYSVPLINGTINYSAADLNIVAITVDGEEVDTIPEDGYVLNEKESYCEVNGNRDDSVELSYDMNSQMLTVTPMTTKGTKCYLYFDEQLSAADIILADKNIDDSRNGAITGTFSEDTTGTVYSVADDWGTSYVYAGAPTDNWVQFAGYYWRIIRINGDGSIRMIYAGTSTTEKNEDDQISTSAYNSTYNDNAYVGYMYGSTGASSYSATHANNNNSTIKGILDSWYKINIVDKGHSDKVSTEAGFCNDRKISTVSRSGYGTLGYGSNATVYAPVDRFLDSNWDWLSSQTPSLKCSQIGNDMFTVSGSRKGNYKLTYPVGLITSDEVVLAGGFGGSSNNSYYLYTGEYYWTMSPSYFSGGHARVFYADSNGFLDSVSVYWTVPGVRPVINLKADVTITGGNGSSSTPFELSGN